MTLLSIEAYDEPQQRAARRALEFLDRIDSRTEPLYRGRRRHERRRFRAVAALCLKHPDLPHREPDRRHSCRVWARCLSQSGLSFIYPEYIDEREVLVGLLLPDGHPLWFRAEIVRTRRIADEGFWEYGVSFRGRVR